MAQMRGPVIFTPEYYARMRENESSGWWNAGMRDVAARLLACPSFPATGRMLDIGCGSGQTMSWFRGLFPEWRTAGIDVAREGVHAAHQLGERQTLVASALDLPVADRSIDAVVTLDVIQHLPLSGGDQKALAEIHRVLRPGGHVLIRTNAQSFPKTPDDDDYDFHKYGPTELRSKIEDAGLEVLRLSRVNALLGLAEIPRELRANRELGAGYHGVLTEPVSRRDRLATVKRAWLDLEGRAVAHGWRLPMGRTLIALCRNAS